jgi:predicted nucleic acid-binding Zn finger protein
MPDISSKEELVSRFAQYSGEGSKFHKAVDAAFGGCVKRHTFLPSGRTIYTVVGSSADEFIDPDRPFCSCESYFYSVLGGKTSHCYHLLAYKMAADSGLIHGVTFDDEEYGAFVQLLASDVLHSRELARRKERAPAASP